MTSKQAARAVHLKSAIVCRMRSEEAKSLDDSEIVRTLAGCVCGRMLIEAATYLRDTGVLSATDLA
jgi:hypothetical protein